MKTTIIARAGAVVLGFLILTLFQVTASYATRWDDGDHELSAVTSCADGAIFFPTSLYTEIDVSEDGSISDFEIHIANKDGNCSALLYSSNATGSPVSLSQHQDIDNLVIVGR